MITASDKHRADLMAQIRELVATHPDLEGREHFDMPYLTECFRADLVLT